MTKKSKPQEIYTLTIQDLLAKYDRLVLLAKSTDWSKFDDGDKVRIRHFFESDMEFFLERVLNHAKHLDERADEIKTILMQHRQLRAKNKAIAADMSADPTKAEG